MFISIVEIVSIFLAFGMAILQLSLTFGAPFGEYALGGSNRILPPKMRFTSCAFALVFVIVGLSLLQITQAINSIFPNQYVKILLIAYTLFLGYAIIGNGIITRSKKEKYVMTPLSIIGFSTSIIILVNYW